nr:MAG TPA: hypothetical protein [Caudoviricetes sp.]
MFKPNVNEGASRLPFCMLKSGDFWVRVTLRVTVKGYTFEN